MSIDDLTGMDWINAKIERATAAHDVAPDSDDHEGCWCAACWAEAHADEFPEEVIW